MNHPPRRRLPTVALIAAVAVVVAVAILVAVALSGPRAASWLHRLDRQPLNGRDLGTPGWPAAFDLQDVEGRERTAADLEGRVALVTFGYTHCPDTCPTTLLRLAEVRRLLGQESARVQVVFVTIDPERDGAGLLGDYVKAFDPSFWALRGSPSKTAAAADAFHAEYHVSHQDREILVEHTVDVFLVDPRGRIRDVLPPYLKARQVADDVKAVLRDSG